MGVTALAVLSARVIRRPDGKFLTKWPATGCPFLIKIMRQGIVWKDVAESSLETMDNVYFWQKFYATGYTFGEFLCNRVQVMERFSIHPCHFPSQVPPRF